MKKVLLVISGLLVMITLYGCGAKKIVEIPQIDPSTLITLEDVVNNAGYTPVIDPSGTKRDGNSATVLYRSEPVGQNDVVSVKFTQFTETVDYQMLFEQYERDKAKRPSAEIIPGIGQEAYIAFPTIHVYDRGCIIEITAGSGSDEAQKNLLQTLAVAAAQRLEEIIPQ